MNMILFQLYFSHKLLQCLLEMKSHYLVHLYPPNNVPTM